MLCHLLCEILSTKHVGYGIAQQHISVDMPDNTAIPLACDYSHQLGEHAPLIISTLIMQEYNFLV